MKKYYLELSKINFPDEIIEIILSYISSYPEKISCFMFEELKIQYQKVHDNMLSNLNYTHDFDNIFQILSSCKCCKRHQSNRSEFFNLSSMNTSNDYTCRCSCRHICRKMLCDHKNHIFSWNPQYYKLKYRSYQNYIFYHDISETDDDYEDY